jgi:hypothetical protein
VGLGNQQSYKQTGPLSLQNLNYTLAGRSDLLAARVQQIPPEVTQTKFQVDHWLNHFQYSFIPLNHTIYKKYETYYLGYVRLACDQELPP